MSTTPADKTDVASSQQYPLHNVKSKGNDGYMVRTRHAVTIGHGRVTYATFPPDGNAENPFSQPGRETNFNISANQTQLVSEIGIHGKIRFPLPTPSATENSMYCWWPAPTVDWIQQYDIYFGGALLTSHTKGYNRITFYKLLSESDYKNIASVCLLEGGIFGHDENATVVGTNAGLNLISTQLTAYVPFPLRPNMTQAALATIPVTGGGTVAETENMRPWVGGQINVRHEGQEGITGPSFRMPAQYGGGIALSCMMPLVGARGIESTDNQGQLTVSDPYCAVPLRAFDYAIKTWDCGTDEATRATNNSGAVEKEFYIPLHNWLTVQALWMPHLNQRIRLRVLWSQQINAVAVDDTQGRVVITDNYRGLSFGQVESRASMDVANRFDTTYNILAASDPITGPNNTHVYARRMDGSGADRPQVTNLNLAVRGYQFNADVAASITAIHKQNNVVSRVTVPRVAEERPGTWNATDTYEWTKQGFTGVFAQLDTLVCHECSGIDSGHMAVGRSFQTAAPISKVETAQLSDPSGLAYGVSNMPGVTIQDYYKNMTYRGSMFPYLFRSITYPFSPDPIGAIASGERKGSQYLNGQWRMALTPTCTRAATLPTQAILGIPVGTERDYLTNTLQTVIREYGDQYATITEHPSGALSIRYL